MTENRGKSRWKNYWRLWWHRPIPAFMRMGFILVVLITILGTLLYHAFREEIELMLTNWMREQTHHLFRPEVTFTDMKMTSPGKFTFTDFTIHDPFEEADYFTEVSRVDVAFNPLQLFSRGINLSLVEIQGGRFHIHRKDHQGELNLSKIFKPSGSKSNSGRRIRIGRFILRDCRVLLEDIDKKPIENSISNLQGRLTSISGEHLVEIDSARINTTYWSIGAAEISGILPIRKKYLGFRQVRVIKGETDLTGNGYIDFEKRTFEYKTDQGLFETEHLPPEIDIRDKFSGTVGVSLAYAGRFDSSSVQVDITLPSGVVFNYPVTNLSTRLDYSEKTLRFDHLKTEICGGTLEANLKFNFQEYNEGYQITAAVENAVVEQIEIPKADRLKGRISGMLELSGRGYSQGNLELAGNARRLRGQLNGVKIDSAGVNFNYRNGKVRVDNLYLNSWESITTAIGDVEKNELFLFVNIESMPARRLRQVLPLTDFTGTIDFSGSLTGSLFDPRLNGTVSINNGVYRALSFNRLEGTCELENLTSTFSGKMQMDIFEVDISGRQFEKLHLNTEIPHTGITRFSPLILVQDSLNSLFCSGFYINHPETGDQEIAVDSLEIIFRGVRATTKDIFEIKRRAETTLVTSLNLSCMGGTLGGELELSGSDSIKSELSFEGLDFSQLSQLTGYNKPAAGTLSGRLHISGGLSEPDCLLEASLENARFAMIASDTIRAKVFLDRGMLTIDPLELITPGSTNIITGRIPLAVFYQADSANKKQGDQRIEISAELDHFPLSNIKNNMIPLTEGTLQGQLKITGTVDKPRLEGEVSLNGGTGVIAPINTRLQNMSGRLVIDGGKILLTGIQSKSPEGLLEFSGSISLDGLVPTDLELDITGKDLIMQQFKYVSRLKLNTDLKLAGKLSDLLLTGKVLVLEGEVNPVISQVPVTSEDQVPRQSALVKIPISPVDYDLQFTAEDNFWLRNRNASIKLKANIQAAQSHESPQVKGEITALAGTYSIFGRKFKIRQGSLQFQGLAIIDPLLDINAERTIRGKVLQSDLASASLVGQGTSSTQVSGERYEIDRNTFFLHIGGTLNEPQFEITVKDNDDREIEPHLTPEQARTLVLIDQTYREFQQQSSLNQVKLLDQAANMALNQANPYIQEFTGIDEFSIESQLFDRTPTESEADERASAKITMGEFLFESVFFSFSQDLLDPSARSVQIEYLISRNSSIIGQTDSRGHFSLDFRYLIKY
ncbi:translocation/assembly module TamB domain-containing protein [Gemmatimonadota bacterium]